MGLGVEAEGRRMVVAMHNAVVEALIADTIGEMTEQVDCIDQAGVVEVVAAHIVDRGMVEHPAWRWNMNKNAVVAGLEFVAEVVRTFRRVHWKNSSFPHLLGPGSALVEGPWEWKNTSKKADGQQEMGGHSSRMLDFVGCRYC